MNVNERNRKAEYLDILSKGLRNVEGKIFSEGEKEKQEDMSTAEMSHSVDRQYDKNVKSNLNTNKKNDDNDNDSNGFKSNDHDRYRRKVDNAKPSVSLESSWVDKNDVVRNEEKNREEAHRGTGRDRHRDSERGDEREGDTYWQKQGTWETGTKYVPTQNEVRHEETKKKQRQIEKGIQKQMQENKQAHEGDEMIKLQKNYIVDRNFRDKDDDDEDQRVKNVSNSVPIKSKEPELDWSRSVLNDFYDYKAPDSAYIIKLFVLYSFVFFI